MKKTSLVIIMSILLFNGCGSAISKKIDKALIRKNAQGIYNISTQNQISYFVIKKSGLVNTYRLDTNNNCYLKNETDGLNSSINGKYLNVDYKKKRFEINSTYWYYGSSSKITQVGSGSLSSSEILETNNIRISTSKHKTSMVTLGELNQSLCL